MFLECKKGLCYVFWVFRLSEGNGLLNVQKLLVKCKIDLKFEREGKM